MKTPELKNEIETYLTANTPKTKAFFQKTRNLCSAEYGRASLAFMEQLETELAEAKTELAELQSLFDLQHKRSMEAMKLWQAAHNETCWPDLGELLVWLMAEIERLKTRVNAEIDENVKYLGEIRAYEEFEKPDLLKLIEQMREALQWYKEQVSSCNRNGDAGELARDRLAKDVGKRAEAALAAERGE